MIKWAREMAGNYFQIDFSSQMTKIRNPCTLRPLVYLLWIKRFNEISLTESH